MSNRIIDAIRENFSAMKAAGLTVDEDDLCYSDVLQFGSMEFTSRRTVKGRKGRPFTIFETAHGPIMFIPWPDPLLAPYRRKTERQPDKEAEAE